MKEKPRIRFLENSLLIDESILVFSDFHIGYEEYLLKENLLARTQLEETIRKLDGIFKLLDKGGIKIEKIVILGDLKHEFGEISDSEWRDTLKLLDYLGGRTKKIILIKGNHDNILGPITKKRNIEIKDYYKIKKICFLHGDKVIKSCINNSEIMIVGHLHPAITLYDEYKKEKYKCFLNGRWKGEDVYILPSFVPLSLGYDIRNLELINEDIVKDKNFLFIDNKEFRKFEIIIYNEKENKVYKFGKLRKLIR